MSKPSEPAAPLPFCAVINPITDKYIDLSPLAYTTTPNGDELTHKYVARGWDNPANFSIGICTTPIQPKEPASKHLWNHTGAFYFDNVTKEYISIGRYTTSPRLRGEFSKKLQLKYVNGSTCPNGVDRRSSILNFVCDHTVNNKKAKINFLGSLHDCSYFFEVRSIYACPTSTTKNQINVGGIFIGIFVVFFLVEFVRRTFLYERKRSERSNSLRWEFIEREPRWKSALKSAGKSAASFASHFIRKRRNNRIGNITTTHAGNGRYSDNGDTGFLQAMEHQNEVLDQLDQEPLQTAEQQA